MTELMLKNNSLSFRAIVLSRILLISVPILLLGVYFTYRKTASSLQETARSNLTESASRKGESLRQDIQAVSSNLLTASQNVILQSGSLEAKKQFLTALSRNLITQIKCVQLHDIQSKQILVSTCDNNISLEMDNQWSANQNQFSLNLQEIHINYIRPNNSSNNQLKLNFSLPVYDNQNKLRYTLSVESNLLQQGKSKPGSLDGNTVVIAENGTILAHPFPEKIGENIQNEPDAKRLQGLMKDAIAGNKHFQHLFYFDKSQEEVLVGYSAINSPIKGENNQKWVILALQTRRNALAELRDIRGLLLLMVLSLIIATILATLYIARVLAKPVEKLTDYALNYEQLQLNTPVPQEFNIKEINQLAMAIATMISRLKDWAKELEDTWQEAKIANQLKNEFLATTSHELRTPLNAIIGCIRLVKDDYCDSREEELDLLQKADDASLHLLRIINDLLDISKMESGQMSVMLEVVNLTSLLQEVIDLQKIGIEQKGLVLNTSDLTENILVRADVSKLKQVLLNILGNAIKFTEKGSIDISINFTENHQVTIIIQDTGIGINPEQQHKLFKHFVMVDGSTTRKFGGTGLGLAISKNFMQLMLGDISLFSLGENQGTVVKIMIPLV